MKNNKNNTRVLVTGGAGFLGSHLCEVLLKRGFGVICLDNFFTGSRKNVELLLSNPNFEIIRHDVTVPITLEVDQIYNLACPASPIHYQTDPIKTNRTSVIGSLNMLELAKSKNIPIFQSSTSEVYGDPQVHPQDENYMGQVNVRGPRACYDEGKRCAETLFYDYHRQHKVNIKVARIFNTYGPKMHPQDGRVVSNFIMQALTGEDITIYGDGSQTRSFCYVDDMIRAFTIFMDSQESTDFPINIGNPEEFTMLELAEEILRTTTSRSKLIYKPLPENDPKQRRPNIELAKEKLKWSPEINLKEGLKKTVDYFRSI